MATPLTITVGTGVPDDQLPAGNYPASLKSVVERTIEVKGETRDVYEWTFEVPTEEDDGSPGEPIPVSGLSSQMTGPKSKTAAFLVALLGPQAVQPGATFTMNDLVGKQCLIQTDLNDNGYAKVIGAVPLPVTATKARQSNRAAAGVAAPAGATLNGDSNTGESDEVEEDATSVTPKTKAKVSPLRAKTEDDDLPF